MITVPTQDVQQTLPQQVFVKEIWDKWKKQSIMKPADVRNHVALVWGSVCWNFTMNGIWWLYIKYDIYYTTSIERKIA